MKAANNTKFVSLDEIAACLNAKQTNKKSNYRIPELAVAWADTRAKYYQATGQQVQDGVHYLQAENGTEQLLSRKACELIEEHATVDGHNVPIMKDGAAKLFDN